MEKVPPGYSGWGLLSGNFSPIRYRDLPTLTSIFRKGWSVWMIPNPDTTIKW